MKIRRPTREIVPLLVILLVVAVSCQEPGHRVEVVTGPQGQTEVRRVPYTPAEQAAQQRLRDASATTGPADPELTALETLWPKVSPSDRAVILDLAKRSAESGK